MIELNGRFNPVGTGYRQMANLLNGNAEGANLYNLAFTDPIAFPLSLRATALRWLQLAQATRDFTLSFHTTRQGQRTQGDALIDNVVGGFTELVVWDPVERIWRVIPDSPQAAAAAAALQNIQPDAAFRLNIYISETQLGPGAIQGLNDPNLNGYGGLYYLLAHELCAHALGLWTLVRDFRQAGGANFGAFLAQHMLTPAQEHRDLVNEGPDGDRPNFVRPRFQALEVSLDEACHDDDLLWQLGEVREQIWTFYELTRDADFGQLENAQPAAPAAGGQ